VYVVPYSYPLRLNTAFEGTLQSRLEEAAAYFNIGTNKLRKLASKEDCTYVLWVGSKCLIKKACFEEYLRKQYSI
jgi:excisionase family DNA binding protein